MKCRLQAVHCAEQPDARWYGGRVAGWAGRLGLRLKITRTGHQLSDSKASRSSVHDRIPKLVFWKTECYVGFQASKLNNQENYSNRIVLVSKPMGHGCFQRMKSSGGFGASIRLLSIIFFLPGPGKCRCQCFGGTASQHRCHLFLASSGSCTIPSAKFRS